MGLMMVTNMVVFAGIAKPPMPVQSPAQIVANRGYEKWGFCVGKMVKPGAAGIQLRID